MKSQDKTEDKYINLWISSLESISEDKQLPHFCRRRAKSLLNDSKKTKYSKINKSTRQVHKTLAPSTLLISIIISPRIQNSNNIFIQNIWDRLNKKLKNNPKYRHN
ncbi:hypothetical protein F8M41_014640 [Gigaspora margarita]|uniref:Uncharacterized protein n=1 Tax=Gigaspora margarita TaxID=4874 RepID=A0A8H4ENQ8_GIGMA|nr:hypothetical protein F8M41_014640 [Gigaspora margarita]